MDLYALGTSDYCNDISRQDQCQAKKKNLNFRVPFLTLGETQKIGELIKKAWTESRSRSK